MQDREVIKRKREGMVQQNTATGEEKQLLLSDYGRELKFNQTSMSYSNTKTTAQQTPAYHRNKKVMKYTSSESPYHHRKKKTVSMKNGSRELVKPKKKKHILKRAGGVLYNKGLDTIEEQGDKNDNLGVQTVSGTVKGVRTAESVYSGAKTAGKTVYRTGKATFKAGKKAIQISQRAARAAVRTTQRVAQAATRVVRAVATAVKNIVLATAKLLANPLTWKVLLIVGAVILLILLISSFIGALGAALNGAQTNSETYAVYSQHIKGLDEEFLNRVNEEESYAQSGGYDSVEVIGRENVNTNVQQLLEILNYEFNEDLSVTQEKLDRLSYYHSLLYFYTVNQSTKDDGEGNMIPVCTITVTTKSPTLILRELGFSAADIELIELRIQQAGTGNTENGGGSPQGNGTFIWPTPGYANITSPYGYRTHPITGAVESFHSGTDIGAPFGASVVAADAGTVTMSRWYGGYGNYVVIDHGNGMATCYGHNSELLVSEGDTVSQGQEIAKVGSTGMSSGPHCHFEIKVNGQFVDPMTYF